MHDLSGIFPFNRPFANFCSNENTKTRYPYDEFPSPADRVSTWQVGEHNLIRNQTRSYQAVYRDLGTVGHLQIQPEVRVQIGYIPTPTLQDPPLGTHRCQIESQIHDHRLPRTKPRSYQAVYREEVAVRHLRFDLLVVDF